MEKHVQWPGLAKIAKQTRDMFPSLLEHEKWGPVVYRSINDASRHGEPAPLPENLFVRDEPTEILVINGDTLEVAANYTQQGRRVCVLNMASAYLPGGSARWDTNTQEESLCRRTTLFLSLRERHDRPRWYQLRARSAIWSPGVLVFRGPEVRDSPILDDDARFVVDVVSAAAIHNPVLTPDGKMLDKYVHETKKNIRTVLRVPVLHGSNDTFILGAWGCGAYNNFEKRYCTIVFAILGSPFEVFRETFT
jgi:uncharacterized protein (TIGR02452 family)